MGGLKYFGSVFFIIALFIAFLFVAFPVQSIPISQPPQISTNELKACLKLKPTYNSVLVITEHNIYWQDKTIKKVCVNRNKKAQVVQSLGF